MHHRGLLFVSAVSLCLATGGVVLPVLARAAESGAPANHATHPGPVVDIHAGHGMDHRQAAVVPVPFTAWPAMPPSGKAREAGFEGRHNMEPTSLDVDLATRCAQASRGLIILDRTTWASCVDSPEQAAETSAPQAAPTHVH